MTLFNACFAVFGVFKLVFPSLTNRPRGFKNPPLYYDKTPKLKAIDQFCVRPAEFSPPLSVKLEM